MDFMKAFDKVPHRRLIVKSKAYESVKECVIGERIFNTAENTVFK